VLRWDPVPTERVLLDHAALWPAALVAAVASAGLGLRAIEYRGLGRSLLALGAALAVLSVIACLAAGCLGYSPYMGLCGAVEICPPEPRICLCFWGPIPPCP